MPSYHRYVNAYDDLNLRLSKYTSGNYNKMDLDGSKNWTGPSMFGEGKNADSRHIQVLKEKFIVQSKSPRQPVVPSQSAGTFTSTMVDKGL